MANKKISELTAATTTNSTDETVLAVSGTSKKITMANLINGIVKYLTTSAKGLTGVNDSNDNEVVKFTGVASAVNEVTFTNAASGSSPTLSASGGDTNVDISLQGKGTGKVKFGTANIKLPNSDGSAGDVLSTDGSGTTTFAALVKTGLVTFAGSTAAGDKTITHGLGRTPVLVKFTVSNYMSFSAGSGGSGAVTTYGFWTNSAESYIGNTVSASPTVAPAPPITSSTKIGAYYDEPGTSSASTLREIDVTSVNSTTITYNLPNQVSGDSSMYIIWEAL